jgi:DUF4097 and DUF4098 domain-containing protein YvlB
MKRASIAGPLILILIGTAFLVKNIWPDIRLFELVMNYWPFVLIGWGVLRLGEILVAYSRGSQLPVAGVSGGEWALVILFTVVSSSIWGIERWSHDNFGRIRVGGVEVFGETFEYPVQAFSARAGAKPKVIVENPRGAVRINAATSEEITVSGRKTVKALDRARANELDRASRIENSVNGDVVNLRVASSEKEGATISADLDITVPAGASVEIRGRSGDVEVTGVTGGVTVDRENAGVRLVKVGGKVSVDVRKLEILRATGVAGDLTLRGRGRDIELEDVTGSVMVDGSYSGETQLRRIAGIVRFQSPVTEFRVESVPGELDLSLSSLTAVNVKGPVVLKAKSKDVQLTDVTDAIELEVGRGDVEIRQAKLPLARMHVEVDSGDIELALPGAAKFSISGETARGEVANSFDEKFKVEQEGGGAKLTGTTGAGPELRLKTRRGLFNLRKMSAAETATVDRPASPAAPKELPAPQRAENQ